MKPANALFAGLVFGLGLLISGMADPARVLGFLTPLQGWNPTLAFVMGGALAVAAPLFALARRRGKALDGGILPDLPRRGVDRALIGGSVLFGLGWGLAGICPGPGIVGLALHPLQALAFLVPMALGLVLGQPRKDGASGKKTR
ncbi:MULTISPECIES: DUF6691 family protein [unclassified Novosphingobium]|uniref:DUF6691 family protein n=1 Tax=unclassified Novosphingobium TaxID=2644732 RepID=UPI0014478D86|nr:MULTISPECIES: DUF6691 family protein [unclassified Novosphingobium]NKJ42163.1 hypothetical protein [Novosphingobium sp. SG720]NMN04550.1 hypothetical protein [Novosphingobium sp. SG919]NMN85457.1 hypothetical protein [Novosphingobium sp. SG916]